LTEEQLGMAKISFVQSINERIFHLQVEDSLVINMDETPSNMGYNYSLL
jgi:hypothetical protein